MPHDLSAGSLCTRDVAVAHRAMPIVEAATRMRERHVGCLVVVDASPKGDSVVGILTDRDIVSSVIAQGLDPGVIQVEDVMSTDVASTSDDASIADVLTLMHRRGLRRVPVLGPEHTLVGVVSLDDVVVEMATLMMHLSAAVEGELAREHVRRP